MWYVKISGVWSPCNEQAAAQSLADGAAVKFVGGAR